MTCNEIITRLLRGRISLNYIPLLNAGLYQLIRSPKEFQASATFYFKKPAEMKNYTPSKTEVDNSSQDSAVKDNHLWEEDIAYMEMLKNAQKRDAHKQHLQIKNNTSIVVTLIVLFLTATAIIFHLKNKVNEEVYSQFYTPLHTNIIIPISSNLTDPSLDKAFREYSNKNYSYALKLFNCVTSDSHLYYISQLYAGVCDMELNQIDAAITHFNNVKQLSFLSPHAIWYKGLCNIKRGNLNEALQIFTEIKKSNNFYSAKAGEILDKLKK